MKKIIFIIFFIFFSTNITFGEESNTGSFYNEELLEIYKTPENKIIKDNRFDYIYNQAKKELSLGNEKKSYDLILEYLNRAGFYNCNVFKYLTIREPNNSIYKDYLKSCEVLNNKQNYERAYDIINFNIKNYTNIIIYLYNIYLLGKNDKNYNMHTLLKKIKEYDKSRLKIIIEYIKFSNKFFGYKELGVNINLLKESDYIYKKFFILLYVIKNKDLSFKESIYYLKKGLSYENFNYYGKAYDKYGIVSYYQDIYNLLSHKYYKEKYFFKTLKNRYNSFEQYRLSNRKIKTEIKNASYVSYVKFLTSKDFINNIDFIKYSKELNKFLSILDDIDRKIINSYYILNNSLEKGKLDTEKKQNIIKLSNLLFCKKNIYISNAEEKEYFLKKMDRILLPNKDLILKNIKCENADLEKFKTREYINNYYGKKLLYIFIFFIIVFVFILKKKKNV